MFRSFSFFSLLSSNNFSRNSTCVYVTNFTERIPIIRTKPRSELSLSKAFSYLRERENHSLDIIRETLETFILQFVRKLLKAFRPITRIR